VTREEAQEFAAFLVQKMKDAVSDNDNYLGTYKAEENGNEEGEEPIWLRHTMHECDCRRWLYVTFPQVRNELSWANSILNVF
jgi:hypothetical protein